MSRYRIATMALCCCCHLNHCNT